MARWRVSVFFVSLLVANLIGFASAADPAGAGTGSFLATCSTSGIHGTVTSTRAIGYTESAPAMVNPGDTFTVAVDVGFPISSTATTGLARFRLAGATAAEPTVGDQPVLAAAPGASSISGSLSLTATGAPGTSIDLALESVSQFTVIGGFFAGEGCVPQAPLLVARVFIGTPPPTDPTISVGDASIVEGNLGAPRTLKVPVTLSSASTTAVSVQYTVADGTATGGVLGEVGVDFRANPTVRTLAFRPTAIRKTPVVKYISISIAPDTNSAEGDETISVDLSNPTGGDALRDSHGVATILDDDAAVGVVLGVGDVSVTEGQSGTRSLAVSVTLSAPMLGVVQVPVSVVGSTATCRSGGAVPAPGVDCRALAAPRVLTFKAGTTSVNFSVTVYPDARGEIDESARVQLGTPVSSPTVDLFRFGIGTVTQLDDDTT